MDHSNHKTEDSGASSSNPRRMYNYPPEAISFKPDGQVVITLKDDTEIQIGLLLIDPYKPELTLFRTTDIISRCPGGLEAADLRYIAAELDKRNGVQNEYHASIIEFQKNGETDYRVVDTCRVVIYGLSTQNLVHSILHIGDIWQVSR